MPKTERFVTNSLKEMSTAQVGDYCHVKGRRYSNTYRRTTSKGKRKQPHE